MVDRAKLENTWRKFLPVDLLRDTSGGDEDRELMAALTDGFKSTNVQDFHLQHL